MAKRIPGAVRAAPPQRLSPQLCHPASSPPEGDQWLHEIKLDGYRLICWIDQGKVVLRTRGDQDWTGRFPYIVREVRQLPVENAILDGEVVALQPNGASSFNELVRALREGKSERLFYLVFDILYLDGFDLRNVTCERRKGALAALLPDGTGTIRYVDHLTGHGPQFFAECCRHGLEGVVSKRRDAPYRSGRVPSWLKAKCRKEADFVIGGFTRPK